MKSIIFQKYGTVDDLSFGEVDRPSCKKKEVLVKIHASSVNDWDWGLLRGKPFINRLLFGLTKPKVKTLGLDVSGIVEEIGKDVKEFQVGDEVFGDVSGVKWGGFAEFVALPPKVLTIKPKSLTFHHAAAIPQAGVLAIQGILDHLKLNNNKHLLINGAGGGCGTFAIQIAKSLGATVTAVDKESKFELMNSLGADYLIDYTKNDFTENIQSYDYILDFAGHHPLLHYKRSLTSNGKYLLIGGASTLILKCAFLGPLISLFTNKKLMVLPHEPNKHVNKIIELYQQGLLKVSVDSTYALKNVPQALEAFGSGNAQGKIIISIVGD